MGKGLPAGRVELPALELECMKVLWDGGEFSVRDVRQHLLPRRTLAYTTVLTLLDRLSRKGVVTRRKQGRAHLYQAVWPRAEARRLAVGKLLENYFGGSQERLMEYLQPKAMAAAAAAAAGSSASVSRTVRPSLDADEEASLDPTLL